MSFKKSHRNMVAARRLKSGDCTWTNINTKTVTTENVEGAAKHHMVSMIGVRQDSLHATNVGKRGNRKERAEVEK